MDWYLIQTKRASHIKASQHLQRQGFEVFLPLFMKTTKRLGKFTNKISPLFPNYLFIGTQSSQVPWASVNATRGVARAVTFDGKYHIIKSEIIEGLRSRCNVDGIIQVGPILKKGDNVRVNTGPLFNFVGHVEKLTEDQRVLILLGFMQQKIKIKISLDDLAQI